MVFRMRLQSKVPSPYYLLFDSQFYLYYNILFIHLNIDRSNFENFLNTFLLLNMSVYKYETQLKVKIILFTHSLCYIYFSQFIHHILFNVSANQSLYQESFSFNQLKEKLS